jgi:uncharacterized HhH-GPD family protein
MRQDGAMAIQIAQDPRADQVLSESPFALLAGMLLDQQFPMERAFAGPAKILERFGTLDPAEIAVADPEQFAALCAVPPAIHRFPGSMAARVQALAARAPSMTGTPSGLAGHQRATCPAAPEPPGFGKQKAQIFVAAVGKQLDVRPEGWEDSRRDYAETGRSAPWPTWWTPR